MTAFNTICEKIHKRDEDFRVYTYDNSYLLEISGRNSDDDWVTAKVFVSSVEEVQEIVGGILNIIQLNP